MASDPIDRDTDYLLPPSVQELRPESLLVHYVVDVVEGLDLSKLELARLDGAAMPTITPRRCPC